MISLLPKKNKAGFEKLMVAFILLNRLFWLKYIKVALVGFELPTDDRTCVGLGKFG